MQLQLAELVGVVLAAFVLGAAAHATVMYRIKKKMKQEPDLTGVLVKDYE